MRCPTCGFENPDRMRFCGNCGTPLEAVASSEERRVVTVLFADVAGFTGLAEALDPEDLRAVVSRFYAAMAGEIQRFGGTVEKYVGDAALAIFGLPEVHEDDAERAVRAALAMRDALARLNDALAREGRPRLGMRVGINTGEVVADPRGGALGEFHLAADAINVAARLQQHGQAGSILVGERTERLVRGIADLVPVGEIALKGKEHPVPAWQVAGLRAERAQRGVPGRRTPLIGRGDEMDLLLRLYDRVARERRPHLITLLGAPGVGKSRLQQEFTMLLRGLPDSPVIRRGRCVPYGERAFSAMAEILSQDAQIMNGDPPDAARRKLEDAVARVLPDDAGRVAPALGFVIGLAFPDAPIARYDPKSAREEAFASCRRYLKARAAAPLVLVFEDLHWADDGLLDLLDHVTMRLGDAPVLFLCLARPELLERRAQWGGGVRNATTIDLEPLSDAGSRALIAALLDVDELPETVRAEIVARAEGNPFFVEEIVRMLMEQGAIVEVNDRWRAGREIERIALPDTVQGVIAARLDHLPDDEKRVLQRAAVVGRTFWLEPVRALVGAGTDLPAALDALDRRELIRERESSTLVGDREFLFKHVLTREVAYASLPRAVRGPAHAMVAQWIERTAGGRVDEVVEMLAHHWSTAGDAPRAVPYYVRAGDRAAQRFDNRRAVEAYTQALTLGAGLLSGEEQADLRQRRGMARQVLGGYDAAQADFEFALAFARSAGDRAREARLLHEITRLHHRRRDRPLPEIVRGFEQARRLAAEVGDRRTEGRALTEIATATFDDGRIEKATRIGLQALDVLRDTGDHSALAGVMNLLCITRFLALDADGAVRWGEQGLAEARAAGDRSREATALSYLGNVAWFAGGPGEAEALLDQAERLAEEIGDRRRLMWVDLFRTFGHAATGRFDRAIAAIERGRRIGGELGINLLEIDAAFVTTYLLAGDYDGARRALAEFVHREGGPRSSAGTVSLAQAFLALEDGRPDEARAALARTEATLDEFPRADHLLWAGPWAAIGWLMLGERARARAVVERVEAFLHSPFVDQGGFAHCVTAIVELEDGRLDDAARYLDLAEQSIGDHPFLPVIAQVEHARSRLALARGRPDEAEAHLRRAQDAVARILGLIEDPEIRQAFERSFIARQIREAAAQARSRTP